MRQDVTSLRAQRLLHADLARALGHGNQHDVHQADSADAERKRADEAHQNFQSQSDDFKLVHLRHDVENPDGLVV